MQSAPLPHDRGALTSSPEQAASTEGADAPTPRFGRYIIIEEHARSEATLVLRAYDPRLGREVALQLVPHEASTDEAHVRALRQAQAMAKLSHPNVVAIYDAEPTATDLLIAMEYVRGSSLDRWLATRSARDIIVHFVAAGRGLAAAHAAGIAHRSFDAASVLIGDDGRARVGGFRWVPADSRFATHSTQAELADAYLEDQYAFCVALSSALAGGPSRRKLGAATLAVVTRGLAERPSERWPNMGTLLDALEQGPRRRRRIVVGAMLGSTAMLCGFAFVGAGAMAAQRCTGAGALLSDVWSAAVQETARQSFTRSELPYALDVWQRTSRGLDAYADAWATTHRSACEATARGEQSAAVMDLQMACLHKARLQLRAASELLQRADSEVIEKAHLIVGGLVNLGRCTDVDALRSEVQPPDPLQRELVDELRGELAASKALREVGKHAAALARVESVVARASAIAYPPLHNEVDLELGLVHQSAGAPVQAQRLLRAALRTALASRQWQQATTASLELSHLVGVHHARAAEGLAFVATAEALLGLPGVSSDALASRLRSNKGMLLDTQGHYAAAEAEHHAAVALAARESGPEHPQVFVARAWLGNNLKLQGLLPRAEDALRKSLGGLERALGPEHPTTATARFDLATILYRQGRYSEAEAEQRIVVAVREKVLGAEHTATASARGQLANALSSQGKLEEAEAHYRAALALQTRALGAEHALLAGYHTSLATILSEAGRHRESEAHMRQALAIIEKTYGTKHPDVARTRSHLAAHLLNAERPADAEAEARRALAIYEATLGAAHPDVCRPRYDLAVALHRQGQHAEAETHMRQALASLQQTLGRDNFRAPIYISRLGEIVQAQHRYEEARDLQREALALHLEIGGADPRDLALVHAHLARALRSLRRYSEAIAQCHAALELLDRPELLGEPEAARVRLELGLSLLENGRREEAVGVLRPAWTRWKDEERLPKALRGRLALALARALPKRRERQVAHSLTRQGTALVSGVSEPSGTRAETRG